MNKARFHIILYISMFLLAGMAMILACRESNQSTLSIPLNLYFTGEYSTNGDDWYPLSADERPQENSEDLIIRGGFGFDLHEYSEISFYLNHISIYIYVNGEKVYESWGGQRDNDIRVCGNWWTTWTTPEVAKEDEIEIHLHNMHTYGNPHAFNEFLNSIYSGGTTTLRNYLNRTYSPFRTAGIFIIVASIALIGVGIGNSLLRLPNSRFLLNLGIMSVLMGVYIYLDTKDIDFISSRIVLNNYIRQLSMMFSAWIFGAYVAEQFRGSRRKIAEATVYALVFVNFVLLMLSMINKTVICDMTLYWAVAQGAASLVLLVLCMMKLMKSGRIERMMLVSDMILLAVLLLELVNAGIGWWQTGICIKIVFVLLFLVMFVAAISTVTRNYQASIRETKLAEELKDSQIALAMSQIKPHFMHNMLVTIGVLCRKDSDLAAEAMNSFAQYLRGNLNSIERSTPIPFLEELEHVRTYLRLEKLRFDDDLQTEFDIQAEDFNVPALSVQPLVENAIRHGLMGREGVCTIILRTKLQDGYYEIIVEDDGAGFDINRKKEDGRSHVGIANVRSRLEKMVGGTLIVESEPGKGTRVTMKIPKERQVEEL